MSLSFWKTLRTGAAVVALLGSGLSCAYADFNNLFDLTWDGPETSTVQECYGGDNFCYDFPITGSLAVELDAEAPALVNVLSDILLPPQTPNSPPAISPNLWHNFDLLEGEYLSTDNEDEIAMVFRPAEIGGHLRAYEIFVNITGDGQYLELTGGIEQDAASPLEPDARFYVSGQRLTTSGSTDLVTGADFLNLQRGYNSAAVAPASEMTGDNLVTAADFARWQSEFGKARGGSLAATFHAVPEPGTISLAVLLALGYWNSRTRVRT